MRVFIFLKWKHILLLAPPSLPLTQMASSGIFHLSLKWKFFYKKQNREMEFPNSLQWFLVRFALTPFPEALRSEVKAKVVFDNSKQGDLYNTYMAMGNGQYIWQWATIHMVIGNNTYGNGQQYIGQWASMKLRRRSKIKSTHVVQVIDSGLRFGRNFISELQIS